MGTEALRGLPYERQIRLAISDPGAIIPRAKVRDTESESVTEWQARAVEAVFALDWRDTISAREAIRSELIRQHIDGDCGAFIYRAYDTDDLGDYVVFSGSPLGGRVVLHEGDTLTLNVTVSHQEPDGLHVDYQSTREAAGGH